MTKTYSVEQINNYIKRMMDADVFLSGFFIEGELSNFKEHSSGHLYFTLKDSRAAINCVMFRGNAAGLEFNPQNGTKVVAYGKVSAYEKTGAYQFYAELMQPIGLGGLYLAFTQLKAGLEAEGLFDASRKISLPRYPKCVGIVTSADGAALRDIINIAARRNKAVKLLLAPTAVQGAGAAAEIAAAVRNLNIHGAADIIIVGRGGGSIEDLWAFNEEVVARAVADSRIPVVSAVGHETDYTICDFAADLRAPTPSAAAEICVPELAETVHNVKWLAGRLNTAMEARVDDYTGYAANLAKRIYRGAENKIFSMESRVANIIRTLDNLAPLNILKRGYGLLYVDGEVVRSVEAAEIGKDMSVRLTDGMVHGKITSTEGDYAREKNRVEEEARH